MTAKELAELRETVNEIKALSEEIKATADEARALIAQGVLEVGPMLEALKKHPLLSMMMKGLG